MGYTSHVDVAERERRSEQAKRLSQMLVCNSCKREFDNPEDADSHTLEGPEHTIRRKFGGPQPGSGRPRKKRASEIIAERVSQHAQELWDELYVLATDDSSSAVRLKAITEMLSLEERERAIAVDEQKSLESLKRDELVVYVMDQIAELQRKGVIPEDVIIDAEFTEVSQGELGQGG